MARPKIYNEERVVTAVRIPVSLRARLDRRSMEESASVNSVVESAIESYLRQPRQQKASS